MDKPAKRVNPYGLTRPCGDCPFLREGGIRLRKERIREIAGNMLNPAGGEFHCHRTVPDLWDDDESGSVPRTTEMHCAGALIFAEKHGNQTQMMRICQRLGYYKPDEIMSQDSVTGLVFDSLDEWFHTAI